MSCVPQGALLALLAAILHCAVTSPVWMPQFLSGGSGRNIRHLPCVSRRTGETGVCMFAFACMKANGTHLGTCIDRFYFGSCCRVDDNAEDNNVLPITTTSKYYLSTFQTVQDNDNRVEDDDLLTIKPIKPPTKKPSVPEKKPAITSPTTTVITTTGRPEVQTTTRKPVTKPVKPTKTTTTKIPPTTSRNPVTDIITRKPTIQQTPPPKITTTQTRPPTFTTLANPTETTTRTPDTTTKTQYTSPNRTTKPETQTTTSKLETPADTTTKKTETQPTTLVTTRKPVTQTKPTQTTTKKPIFQPKPTQTTTRRPIVTQKPLATTTRNPVTQTRPPETTTRRPVTQTRPPETTTRRPVTQTRPPETTTRRPVTQTRPPETTTRRPVTQTRPPETTTRRPVTQTRPPETTTRRPVTQTRPPETTTKRHVTQTKPPETTTRKPITQSKPTTTTRKPIIQTKPTVTTRKPVTQTRPSTTTTTTKRPVPQTRPPDVTTKKPVSQTTTTTRKPVTKPKPPVLTTTKKPVVTTTHKPPTKKPTIKTTTTERLPETTSTPPASLITWTMLQEPPRTEAVTTTTETSDGWILVPVTTHPPSGESTTQPGTTTSSYTDFPSDVTTTAMTATSRPESTIATTLSPEVTNDTLDVDLNMTDFRQVCGRRLFPESRIVGGEKSSFGKWPWQISLRQWRTSTYLHKCGAALLNENWAITAAHCVENVPPSDLLLRLGEHDLSSEEEPYGYQERRVQIVASHPQFDPRTFEYDLALLRFYEPVTFQPNILPICVPQDDTNFVGHTAYVTGWGRLYEDGPLPSVLQEVSVPVINNSVCETMYRTAGYIEHIPEIFICAGWRKGGFDSCEGDSGGPMVIQRPDKRWLLAGVISWGIGCAEPNQPGVYTRISEFREWINQILQF